MPGERYSPNPERFTRPEQASQVFIPSTKMWLTLRRGEPTHKDWKFIIGAREDARRWIKNRGSEQWSNYPETFAHEAHNNLVKGNTWILIDEDEKTRIATLTLSELGDATLWDTEERRQPALYISKLSVRRDCAGIGIGEALLDWAHYKAAEESHDFLRLDCWSNNAGLRSYYARQGFTYLRTIPNRPSGALFQRRTERVFYHLPMPDGI